FFGSTESRPTEADGTQACLPVRPASFQPAVLLYQQNRQEYLFGAQTLEVRVPLRINLDRVSPTPSTLHNLWKGRRSAKPAKIAIPVCDRTQRDTRGNLQGRRHVSRYKHLNHPWRNAEILSLASILASAPIKRCC